MCLYNFSFSFLSRCAIIPPKKRNPVNSITLYWPFSSLNSHSKLTILTKKILQSLAKSCSSSWLYASFDTFWVQIDLIRYEHWSFTCSMEFSKQNFVFSIFCSIFRDRFLLKYSVNLHSKGVKRSVKSWAKWFCKSHLENFYIWVRRIKALKIRSVQCYGMNRIPFFLRMWRSEMTKQMLFETSFLNFQHVKQKMKRKVNKDKLYKLEKSS